MITAIIVEDDPMVAELNKNYLAAAGGFTLAGTAANGEEALALLEDHPGISLVLLDVFMPRLDGLSLLAEIRRRFQQVDIIMVTAARTSEDIQAALRLGVIDYIVKPFTFERFETALHSYRERVRLLHSSRELSQDMLDKRIFAARKPAQHLPKGIDEQTLHMVREAIAGRPASFSIKDLVGATAISRVSLKKYVDYLQERGELESSLHYPAMGRPVTMYHRVSSAGQVG